MSHTGKIKDADALFVVDPITRQIKNASSTKTTLMQYDHNSERFGFTLPRYIEGHDMMESTKAEVHYINVDAPDVYEMTDLAIDEADENKVTCSWLISQNATSKVGALDFLLRFSCVAEDGAIEYAWSTGIHKGITVSKGIYNTDVIVEQNADALEQMEAEIKDHIEKNGIQTDGNIECTELIAKKAEIGTFNDDTGAKANNAVASGNYTIAKGDHSFAANHQTQANHTRSAAFGNNTKTSTVDQLVCGKFNDSNVAASIFQVGCGTSKDNRKNALNVTDKGDVQVLRNVISSAKPTSDNHLINKAFFDACLLKIGNVRFKSVKLEKYDVFTIKPGMIFFFQSDSSGVIATIRGWTPDNGDFEHEIYGLTFGFCTELGQTHDKESNRYRMSLNYKDGGFTTDFESKNKYLDKGDNPTIEAMTPLYIWHIEKETE